MINPLSLVEVERSHGETSGRDRTGQVWSLGFVMGGERCSRCGAALPHGWRGGRFIFCGYCTEILVRVVPVVVA